MKHRLIHPVPPLVALLALAAWDTTDPAEASDIDITVECSGCPSVVTGDNLRLSLYPFSALTGDTIRAWEIIRATNHRVASTTTVTAFTAVEPGQYIVSAAALRPAELDDDCRVSTGATAYPAGHFPEEYPYVWPVLQVKVPLSPQAAPTVRLDCRLER